MDAYPALYETKAFETDPDVIQAFLNSDSRIGVADNGPGIVPELIAQIFDPFVTTKPVGKGLGLGLSISYGIVQDFRGRIHASNRPQGGAELVIELPRVVPEVLLEKAIHV